MRRLGAGVAAARRGWAAEWARVLNGLGAVRAREEESGEGARSG
ncbi:unnamed protein product [[Actinomadura] parvosata subsp. kistnae]|nr:unnamed protein product [Actinomadura parvosata subsp. kistnae]